MRPRLQVTGLSRHFDGLYVTRNVSLDLDEGARHALIGPNGAGKTTLVNLISGALAPDAGRIVLDGDDVTGLDQAARVKRGLVRTFQINQLFPRLPVLDNVALAVAERRGESRRLLAAPRRGRETVDEALALMDRLRLTADALKPVNELPYGRQRLVEIAIALALEPRVLLLDEPAAGVPSAESHIILDALAGLDPSIAILIIEHDMDVVFRFADRVSVLVQGSILVEGSPDEIAAHHGVREVYLGEVGHG